MGSTRLKIAVQYAVKHLIEALDSSVKLIRIIEKVIVNRTSQLKARISLILKKTVLRRITGNQFSLQSQTFTKIQESRRKIKVIADCEKT